MAEETVVKYPQILAPVHGSALTPAEFAAKVGGNTVTMVFEKPVLYTPEHGTRVSFPKGVHEVPEAHADHWYLRNNDARVYNRPVALGAVPAPAAPVAPTAPVSDDSKSADKGKSDKADAKDDKADAKGGDDKPNGKSADKGKSDKA